MRERCSNSSLTVIEAVDVKWSDAVSPPNIGFYTTKAQYTLQTKNVYLTCLTSVQGTSQQLSSEEMGGWVGAEGWGGDHFK